MHGLTRYASRGWPLLALVVLLSCVALVRAAEQRDEGAEHSALSAATSDEHDRPGPRHAPKLRLSGSVRGMYPGASRRLEVKVGNAGDHSLLVTAVRVRAGDAAPGCGAANLRIPVEHPKLVVPAGASADVTVRVLMRNAAPDACQDARFPLALSAAAESVR